MPLTLFALIYGQLVQREVLTVAGTIHVISTSEGAWKSGIHLCLPVDGWGRTSGASARCIRSQDTAPSLGPHTAEGVCPEVYR